MEERNLRKTRIGIVVSDKMDKTITVAIQDNGRGYLSEPRKEHRCKCTGKYPPVRLPGGT